MATTDGNPAGTGTDDGAGTPRDGDQQRGSDTARNGQDDAAARNGQQDDGDDLESVEDATRLREMIREMRGHERRRNDGYNTLRTQNQQLQDRLAAIERDRQAGQPVEERMKQLEKDIADRDARIQRMEQERKDEKTETAIEAAARRLNAADPADVARLIDRAELTIEDDGTVTNAEQVVRAFLKKKPHHLKSTAGGDPDGGKRGESGKGDKSDMNSILRASRPTRRGSIAND